MTSHPIPGGEYRRKIEKNSPSLEPFVNYVILPSFWCWLTISYSFCWIWHFSRANLQLKSENKQKAGVHTSITVDFFSQTIVLFSIFLCHFVALEILYRMVSNKKLFHRNIILKTRLKVVGTWKIWQIYAVFEP